MTGDELAEIRAAWEHDVTKRARPTVLALLAEVDRLQAECERHRRANLVRAVIRGVDPEWVAEIIAAEGFDAVPWRIAAAR